ncbi:MAG: sulfurtransferase-like selenium metabolism protein YedF [Clostridiales bacterium]|nr:sulfurtransferase-like selenium metabolism protein YedF [Clostridiales bacterium]
MEHRTVDARGLDCPLPVVNAKKALGEFKKDGILTVLADNEIAVQNLQKFAAQRGLQASGKKNAEKGYEVTIQVILSDIKTPGGSQAGESPAVSASSTAILSVNDKLDGQDAQPEITESSETCRPDIRKKGMVVVLSANIMGSGDEKLGKTLMKAFIFALTKQDVIPEIVLCYNTGAYLTCEGSDFLEDFRELESLGVRIMTCGTCLDFYGLKETLAVGTVTNMYDIVETMEQASLIIKP